MWGACVDYQVFATHTLRRVANSAVRGDPFCELVYFPWLAGLLACLTQLPLCNHISPYRVSSCARRLTQSKNIMVSANTRKGCYISILNIIQGAVDPTQVPYCDGMDFCARWLRCVLFVCFVIFCELCLLLLLFDCNDWTTVNVLAVSCVIPVTILLFVA